MAARIFARGASPGPPGARRLFPWPRQRAFVPVDDVLASTAPKVADHERRAAPPVRPAVRVLRLPFAPAVALGVALVLAWQLVAQSGSVSSVTLPAPADVLRAFIDSLMRGHMLGYAAVTLQESVGGFVLGALVGVPVAFAMFHSPLARRAVQPYVAASQALPAIALAPLLATWLPYGLPPVIALCALIVFFPMVVTTMLGLRSLDRDVIDAARVAGAGTWAMLRDIEWPLALPSILAGMRTSLTLSVTGAVVGEFVSGYQGLGGLLTVALGQYDAALEFAVLLALALFAAALYGVARLAERRFSYLEEM